MARLLASEAFHYLLTVLSSSENLGISVRRTRDEHARMYYYNTTNEDDEETRKSLL